MNGPATSNSYNGQGGGFYEGGEVPSTAATFWNGGVKMRDDATNMSEKSY